MDFAIDPALRGKSKSVVSTWEALGDFLKQEQRIMALLSDSEAIETLLAKKLCGAELSFYEQAVINRHEVRSRSQVVVIDDYSYGPKSDREMGIKKKLPFYHHKRRF